MPKKVKKVKSEEAIVTVSKTIVKGAEPIVTNEYIKVRMFGTDTAKIGMELGVTLNMDNFNFVKVSVSSLFPCYVEEAKEMAKQVTSFTIERLKKEVTEFKKEFGLL